MERNSFHELSGCRLYMLHAEPSVLVLINRIDKISRLISFAFKGSQECLTEFEFKTHDLCNHHQSTLVYEFQQSFSIMWKCAEV